MKTKIKIGKHLVGPGERCLIIAEIGVNHNGSIDIAKRLIEEAYQAGACAVKFQSFSTERLVTKNAQQAKYQRENTQKEQTQYELLKDLELKPKEFKALKSYCDHIGILFLSSPFDEIAADMLDNIGIEAFKIPSGEITNFPLLQHIAQKGKPLILSTGMADFQEVKDAINVIKKSGGKDFILLQCTSNYPARPEDINLRAMQTMREYFGCPVGFSDHTIGCEIVLAAVAMGANVVEKHFTLNKKMKGPDHKVSIEPEELKYLVESIRKIELALGDGKKIPSTNEYEVARLVRKSIFAKEDILANEIITLQKIMISRPGDGLPPSFLSKIIGKVAKTAIKSGMPIKMEHVK